VAPQSDLERTFSRRMRGLYDRAKSEAGYNASIFLRMLGEHGALETARRLVMSPLPSEGFTQLCLKGRLDLTVESLVLEPQFEPLFDEEMRDHARERLRAYGEPDPRT
jgi:hypothetical protein